MGNSISLKRSTCNKHNKSKKYKGGASTEILEEEWKRIKNEKNPYIILDITPSDVPSEELLKKVYKKMAVKWHPDKSRQKDGEIIAGEIFKKKSSATENIEKIIKEKKPVPVSQNRQWESQYTRKNRGYSAERKAREASTERKAREASTEKKARAASTERKARAASTEKKARAASAERKRNEKADKQEAADRRNAKKIEEKRKAEEQLEKDLEFARQLEMEEEYSKSSAKKRQKEEAELDVALKEAVRIAEEKELDKINKQIRSAERKERKRKISSNSTSRKRARL